MAKGRFQWISDPPHTQEVTIFIGCQDEDCPIGSWFPVRQGPSGVTACGDQNDHKQYERDKGYSLFHTRILAGLHVGRVSVFSF